MSAHALEAGEPVISVDTKKKALIGNYKNAGRELAPTGKPILVNPHDFKDKELGKAIPYGIYDVALSVNVRRDAHHRGINDLEGENGERRTCRRRARMELGQRLRLLPPAAKTSLA